MTEAEAKKLVCNRMVVALPPNGIASLTTPNLMCCLGSACTAWDWDPEEEYRFNQQKRYTTAEPAPMQGDCMLKRKR